jgi:hypothetical protein
VQGWSSTVAPFVQDKYRTDASDSASTGAGTSGTGTQQNIGAWFVRDSNQVPAPATLSLVGFGLASIWISRRKRAAKA